MIDAERHRARHVVAELHAVADRATGEFAQLLAEAACLLDGYQAGLHIATPHPASGYTIVSDPERAAEWRRQIHPPQHQPPQEAA